VSKVICIDTTVLVNFTEEEEFFLKFFKYFLNEESSDYKLFKNRFRKTMKSTPEFYDAVGFDVGIFLFRKLLEAKKINELFSIMYLHRHAAALHDTLRGSQRRSACALHPAH